MAPGMLMAQKNDEIPDDVAALRGSRFAVTSESEQGKRSDEPKFKRITGGELITARYLNAEFFTFNPEIKIWMERATNPRFVDRQGDL